MFLPGTKERIGITFAELRLKIAEISQSEALDCAEEILQEGGFHIILSTYTRTAHIEFGQGTSFWGLISYGIPEEKELWRTPNFTDPSMRCLYESLVLNTRDEHVHHSYFRMLKGEKEALVIVIHVHPDTGNHIWVEMLKTVK